MKKVTENRMTNVDHWAFEKKQQISYSYSNENHLNRQKNAIWLTRKIQPMLKDEVRGAVVIFSHTTALMHEKKVTENRMTDVGR